MRLDPIERMPNGLGLSVKRQTIHKINDNNPSRFQQQSDRPLVRGQLRAAPVRGGGWGARRVGHGRAPPRNARLERERPVPDLPRSLYLERPRHDGEETAG